MQRTSDVLEDRADVGERVDATELMARLSAERGVSDTGRRRHRHRPVPQRPAQRHPAQQRPRRRRIAPEMVALATVLVSAAVALGVRAGNGTPDDLDGAPVAASAPAAAPAAAPAVDEGVQAAVVNGWTRVDGDEFTGALDARWNLDDGPGRDGNGRRSPFAIAVRDDAAVIRGDAQGTTGAMWWRDGRETGRWELRARFPGGDGQYRPVLLLSPADRGSGREITQIDVSRLGEAAPEVPKIDVSKWHNYAVEVTGDRVSGYVDGLKWFESTDRNALPRGSVHPVIQLDWFPQGAPPEPSELVVDWMRVYR